MVFSLLFSSALAQLSELDLSLLRGRGGMMAYPSTGESMPLSPEPTVQFEAIEDSAYKVGPGDYLTVGYANRYSTLPINPEGFLILENIGPLNLNGKSLAQSKELIKAAMSKAYKSDRLFVTLAKAKNILVPVTGSVANPGFYNLTASSRLSDAINLAGGFTVNANRRIRIIQKDLPIRSYDLFHYFNGNDLAQNPYLSQGDRIVAEAIDYGKGVVEIREGGSIRIMAFVEGETLRDLLYRHDNFKDSRDWEFVRVYRNGKMADSVPRFKAGSYNPQANDVLELRDKKLLVYISGAVSRPGPYDFNANFSPLDYISQAGINQTTGNYKSVKVLDREGHERTLSNTARQKLQPGDHIIIDQSKEVRARDWIGLMLSVASLAVAVATFVSLSR